MRNKLLKQKRFLGLLFFVVVMVAAIMAFSATRKVTLTTYYPAPYGKYNDLQSKTLTVSDRVGIGTTDTQGVKLKLYDSGSNGTHMKLENADTGGRVWNILSSGTANNGGAGNFHIYYELAPVTNLFIQGGTGNVGIGTVSPLVELHVKGTGPGVAGNADIATESSDGYKWTMSTQIGGKWILNRDIPGTLPSIVVQQDGNVGIGTTSPAGRLNVVGTTPGIFIASSSHPQFTASIINTSSGWPVEGALRLVVTPNNDPFSSILDLYGAGGADRKFFFNSNGSGQADGSFGGGGADYAEYFKNLNEEVIKHGTIVALENGKVRIAKKGDNFIVGPVSSKPGFIGNNGETEEERERYPKKWTAVALLGQAPVKVSLENGPINVGDYLTSSSTPGIAMKATKPGRVIGQALESFNEKNKSKKILCFVNPHFWDGDITAHLQSRLVSIETENSILKEELASLKQELTAIKQENSAIKQELSVLQRVVAKLQGISDNLRTEGYHEQ